MTATYRDRRKAAGLCELCKRPRETARHCAAHRRHYNRRATARGRAKRAAMGRDGSRVICGACGVTGHNVRTCRGFDVESVDLAERIEFGED